MYVLTIKERNHSWAGRGPVRSEHASEAEAHAALVDYVKRNWEAEVGEEAPADEDEMVEEYFAEVMESYTIRELSKSHRQATAVSN